MVALICFVLAVLALPIKSKNRLEAENAVLRHQLIVLQRKARGRAHLTKNDRWFFVQMYRWFPSILKVVTIIEPETLVRWHQASPSTCSIKRRQVHGQATRAAWPAMDGSPSCAIMPQISPLWTCSLSHNRFRPPLCFRRRPTKTAKIWSGSTSHATAEWVVRQITEAFPWDGAPGYMIRDRDRIYGIIVTRRLRAMGIRETPTVPASPWQNGFAERLIGSIRRECLDHVIVLGRGTSVPDSEFLCRLLQLRQNASIFEQGCAGLSSDSSDRIHSFTLDPRRAPPSLRPRLGFRYTQVQGTAQNQS